MSKRNNFTKTAWQFSLRVDDLQVWLTANGGLARIEEAQGRTKSSLALASEAHELFERVSAKAKKETEEIETWIRRLERVLAEQEGTPDGEN